MTCRRLLLLSFLLLLRWSQPLQLCQAKGFVCEFCGNDKDIIFPFQLNKCQRCEGEPTLQAAGSTAPTPRFSNPLTWRDWKISKPRRLAKALSKDRREGEGGEEGLEAIEGEEEEEEEGQGKRGVLHTFPAATLAEVSDDEQTSGRTESEKEEETRVTDKGREDVSVRREKLNLLKVLHIDRLRKNMSRESKNSDSETCSSLENLSEAGQARRKRWSGFTNITKGFTKREREDEAETEAKEEEVRLLEGVRGSEERGKARWEVEEKDDISDKALAAETGNQPTFTLKKFLNPHRRSALFSRGRSSGEEGGTGGSEGTGGMDTEEEETGEGSQTSWRSRKTRRARRVTRGRRGRDGTERGPNTEMEQED